MQSQKIHVGGQIAWEHDHTAPGGRFHTFDGLQCAGDRDQPRKVHVWLPPGYGTTGRRYPTVYCNDGHGVFFPGGPACGGTLHTIAEMARNQEIPAPVVVGIAPLDRGHEYLHAKEFDGVFPFWRGGGLRQYASYVANDVRGFIDRHYLTLADRRHRVAMGSSHGGLAAFWTGVMHGGDIGNVIAMSSSFWAGEIKEIRSSKLLRATRGALHDRKRRPRIYIDWGLCREGGFHNDHIEKWATWRGRDMAHVLGSEFGYRDGHDLVVVEDPVGGHSESAWVRRLPGALRFALDNPIGSGRVGG